MVDTNLGIEGLELDELGRVVLSDEMLNLAVTCTEITSAGANISCPGSSNPTSCTNSTTCNYSQNGGYCNNGSSCSSATNRVFCV